MSGNQRVKRGRPRRTNGKLKNRPTRLFLIKYSLEIGWPVPLLEKYLSSSDLAELMAYDRIEPFGPRRDDLRAGIIASVIANANRSPNGKAFKPSDFMANFEGNTSTESDLDQQIKEAFNNGDFG